MIIKIRLFAAARQLTGEEVVEVDCTSPVTVADLRRSLAASYPALGDLLQHTRFAVDAAYAGDEQPILEGQEVACIPPVSGG